MSFASSFCDEIVKISRKKGSSLLGTIARGAAYGSIGSSVVSMPAAIKMFLSPKGRAFSLRGGMATTLLTALLPTLAGAGGGALAHRFVKKRKGPKQWKKPLRWDL